jgi:pimeloyl-ACP methyl ester carboxylesterase
MIDPTADHGHVPSRDGTPIAWWRYAPSESGADAEPAAASAGRAMTPLPRAPHALLLVHGTTADHTTFRVLGPRLAAGRPTYALDRRGREASGDGPAYAIEREFEDVAAVAEALATASGMPVDVLGHSYGGRCAMGAALLTRAIRRVVSYEGAVPPGLGEARPDLLERLETLRAAGRGEDLLRVFLTEVIEMTPAEWEAFRTSPVWPARLAAAHTIVRELRAGANAADAWERYGAVTIPILQILGSESAPLFRAGAEALDARLARGRIAVIAGARHNAHHTHAGEIAALVADFLDEPDPD